MCCRSIDSFCMKTIHDKMHDILIRSPSAVHGHSSGTGGCVTKLLRQFPVGFCNFFPQVTGI